MDLDPQQLPLGFLLNTAGRRLREETEAALAGGALSVVDLGILWMISLEPNRPQAEYARFQKRDVTTFGRYVDRLEAKGFLVRTPQAHDRRIKALSVTKPGLKALEEGRRKAYRVETSIVSTAPELIGPLKSLLVQLLNSMD